jgi:hypothetical protein
MASRSSTGSVRYYKYETDSKPCATVQLSDQVIQGILTHEQNIRYLDVRSNDYHVSLDKDTIRDAERQLTSLMPGDHELVQSALAFLSGKGVKANWGMVSVIPSNGGKSGKSGMYCYPRRS